VLQLDALLLRVQLNLRSLLLDLGRGRDVNIISEKVGTEQDTRFEDRSRLPLGELIPGGGGPEGLRVSGVMDNLWQVCCLVCHEVLQGFARCLGGLLDFPVLPRFTVYCCHSSLFTVVTLHCLLLSLLFLCCHCSLHLE
jgi:hypothetical protein